MGDRETTIRGLESLRDVCKTKSDMSIGKGRTAWAYYAIVAHLALDMLRELEPVEPISNMGMLFCGNCRYAILRTVNYCPKCGRKVAWNNADH